MALVTCPTCAERVEPLLDEGTPFVTYSSDDTIDAIVEGALTFVCPRCRAEISSQSIAMASRVASRGAVAGQEGEAEGPI